MRVAAYAEPVSAFGDQLKAWRRRSGLSQETLGRRLGHKRPSTVQSWERGRRPPKLTHLTALADALGLSDDERRVAADLLIGVKATPAIAPAVAPVNSDLLEALRDAETATSVRGFLEAPPAMRKLLAEVARLSATLLAGPRVAAPKRAQARGGRTKSQAGPHRLTGRA
jgi:transcriptional regulator with XRE-family HTH domain